MKKILFFVCALATMSMVSCGNGKTTSTEVVNDSISVDSASVDSTVVVEVVDSLVVDSAEVVSE